MNVKKYKIRESFYTETLYLVRRSKALATGPSVLFNYFWYLYVGSDSKKVKNLVELRKILAENSEHFMGKRIIRYVKFLSDIDLKNALKEIEENLCTKSFFLMSTITESKGRFLSYLDGVPCIDIYNCVEDCLALEEELNEEEKRFLKRITNLSYFQDILQEISTHDLILS